MRKRLQAASHKASVGIVEVAQAAGVSTASVSRVVNAPDSVTTKTRQSVQDAIKELGYIPNGAARALSSQRSQVIAAIIPTIDHSIFAHGIQALQSRLQQQGFHLLLAASNYDPQQEYALCQNFLEQQVAGIIMMGEMHLPGCIKLLERECIPYVNAGTYSPINEAYCVGNDNAAASAKAVKYLLDLGHRKFAMIAGISEDNDRASNRIKGVQCELRKHNLYISESRLIEMPYEIENGRSAFRHLMQQQDPATAVLCGNDVLAFGAILEAPRINVDIPRQVSVVGFDDLVLSRHLKPSLTTIQIPTELMWTRAADVLLGILRGADMPRATEIDVNLVVRESTAPPQATGELAS